MGCCFSRPAAAVPQPAAAVPPPSHPQVFNLSEGAEESDVQSLTSFRLEREAEAALGVSQQSRPASLRRRTPTGVSYKRSADDPIELQVRQLRARLGAPGVVPGAPGVVAGAVQPLTIAEALLLDAVERLRVESKAVEALLRDAAEGLREKSKAAEAARRRADKASDEAQRWFAS